MAGTELAKAYVQIIPSAQGIKGKLTNILGGEADEAGKSAGKTLGGSLGSVIKKTIAAAGIGTALKRALTEGAALQQSLGGIETLFKDSANKVITNAKNAYMTAGMSANEYMENVTSFSASLLQGLGQDTEKAADYADRALINMSDNANKMGTNMELIQNAYQGFAKSNYTMLDNLKLGYGGTKTEMQRLIADAAAMTDIQKKLGITVDESSMSFDNVINAISVMQDHLGLSGATADEAAKTFSGSLSAMKAAASNLLGSLSLGEDIKPYIEALLETTGTFVFDNMLPMVGNIISGLVEYVADAALNTDWESVITQVLENIKIYLVEGLQTYFGADTTLISEMFDFLITGLPEVFETVQEIISSFGEFLQVIWEEIGQPIFETIKSLFEEIYLAVIEKLPEIKEFVATCFEDISAFWEENLKPCLEAIGDFIQNILAPVFESVFRGFISPLIDSVFKFVKQAWEGTLKPVFTGITQFLTGIFTLDFQKAWDGIKNIVKGASNGIITMVEGFVNGIISALNGLFAGVNTIADKIGGKIGEFINIPTISPITLPRLAEGGILEKGQVGLLEGSGAEAVVPLENNHKWISKVAKEMNGAVGNNVVLERILELLIEIRERTPEEIAELLARIKISIGEREFARLLKEVEGYA